MGSIEIYCDDSSHEDRRWVVDALARDEHGWHPQHWGKSGRKGAKSTMQFVKETVGAELKYSNDPAPDRVRYRFRCHLCGVTVVARFDNATVICDTLAEHGVSQISLSSLAAIV
jgi:hypothetical protein